MVIDLSDLPKIKNEIKEKATVLVGGCFDVFHIGHLEFLTRSKEQGDYLIIILESDESLEKRKKRKAVHSQDERAQILDALKVVDLVIKLPVLQNEEYWKLTEEIKPKIIAVTEGDPFTEHKRKLAQEVGGELRVVTPFIKDFSSTKITNHASISRS